MGMRTAILLLMFVLASAAIGRGQACCGAGVDADELGAHINGGRGCAACHAPHSGGRGQDQELAAESGEPNPGGESDGRLWGQNVALISQETLRVAGSNESDGSGYAVRFSEGTQWYDSSAPGIYGIGVCLSCHDGNVSQGSMMTSESYEHVTRQLPESQGTYSTTSVVFASASNSVPSLLSSDRMFGRAISDHPVGPGANYDRLNYPQPLSAYGLTYTLQLSNLHQPVAWTATGPYAAYLVNYGAPAVDGMVADSANTVPYVACTTCHNQHQMHIYSAGSGLLAIQGVPRGFFQTDAFVNAPYNSNAGWTPSKAPSTTQFCRQCHFGIANEAVGANGIPTAF